MAAILSPEILRLIAHHIEHSNSTTRRSDIAAFALGARALARAADPYRLRAVRVDGLADLENFYRSVQMEWRDLGGSLSELVVRFGPSNGKGKARNCGPEDQLAASASPTRATELLGLALMRTRRLTKLDIKVDSSSVAVDEVLPSLTANCRTLRHVSLITSSPLSTNVLDKFLRSQPRLTDLELPNQFQAYPPEPIVVSLPPPQKAFKVVTGDGRRKRLRLTIPRSAPASPCSSVPSLASCQGTTTASALNCLQSVSAPVSFILSLPSTSPLQSVVTTDADISRSVQRRFFEKLGEHGSASGTKLVNLEVTLQERSMSLGVMQEITRNLRELETLVVRSLVKDAYFTYFLQDLAGCLSRCRHLRALTFECPMDYPYRDGRGREAVCRYTSLPNSDPSIPLPSLALKYHNNPACFSGFGGHLYPPNGPEVFHREQYIVNLYGTTNPSLRAVTMPAGTTWRWCHDELPLCEREEERSSVSPAPTLRERCPSPPAFDHPFAAPPVIALPELPKPQPKLPQSPKLAPVEVRPAAVVPSSPVGGRRQSSPALSTAWGWEPDVACVEARAWWEECGLKPFHSASPGVSETEVDEDYDCEMEDTDVEEEEELDDDDRVALFHPYPPRTNSKIVMPVEILDDEPTSPPTLKAAVIPSSPRPSLKRKAVDDY
ncbi:hypothetical protein FRC01_013416 [Tulasnella sp. 417]|nr:hypothetical protein FRC01_013416 [Tulasnella sp. 417]